MLFLPPNQQRQSTEDTVGVYELNRNILRADLKEYCLNTLQRVQQFIPVPWRSDRKRTLLEVGDGRVNDEVAPGCGMQCSS